MVDKNDEGFKTGQNGRKMSPNTVMGVQRQVKLVRKSDGGARIGQNGRQN